MEYISESEHFPESQSRPTNTLYRVIFHLKSRVNRGFFGIYITHSVMGIKKDHNGNRFYSIKVNSS